MMLNTLQGIMPATSLIGLSSAATATPIEIYPTVQAVDLGGQVQTDILATPDPFVLVGAYDFLVNFDDTILAVATVAFESALGTTLDSIL
jgi:hypothetical protein